MLQKLRDFAYDEHDWRRYDSSGDAATVVAARMWASGFIIGAIFGGVLVMVTSLS